MLKKIRSDLFLHGSKDIQKASSISSKGGGNSEDLSEELFCMNPQPPILSPKENELDYGITNKKNRINLPDFLPFGGDSGALAVKN
jgi:hypothetical protein